MEEECSNEMSQLLTKLWLIQDHVTSIKKKGGNITSKSQEVYKLPGSKENGRVLHGTKKHASVAWRVDPINQDNKYRALVEKLIPLELNDWPKFQECLKKKLHPAKFQQAQTQQEEVINK